MARGKETETIEIIPGSYVPDEIQEQIKEQYGSFTGFTAIKLYRFNVAGERFFLTDYQTLPKEIDIQNKFGGGRFQLFIQWKIQDEQGASERKMDKRDFLIEGEPKIPFAVQPSPDTQPGQNGHTVLTEEQKFDQDINRMIKLRTLFGGGDNKSDGTMQMVIENMKQQHEITLKMIEGMNNNKGDGISKEIISAALLKTEKTDFDTFLKFYNILKKDQPEPAEINWIKELAPVLGPLAAKFLGGSSPGPGGAPAQIAGPSQAAGNEIIQAIQGLAQAINGIDAKLIGIDKRLKDVENELFEDVPDENTENNIHSIVNSPDNKENINMGIFENIEKDLADDLRNADPKTQDAKLVEYVQKTGVQKTYDWCLKWQLVSGIDEFNQRLTRAGLQQYHISTV